MSNLAPVIDSGAQSGLASGTSLTPMTMSRSPTMGSDQAEARTLTDFNGVVHEKGSPVPAGNDLPSESTLGKVEKQLEESGAVAKHTGSNPLSTLPATRKSILLFCFCLAMFIDAAGVSATFIFPTTYGLILRDQAWVLGTYSLAFAATLLFSGRLADLYPPHRVYTIGFVGIAVFYLIISFMEDQYAFFVLRAISALLAVLTIPSAINMIIQMYPEPEEQAKKLALFGMAGALANTIALVLGGVFLLASWRWYFRFITILVAPFSVACWFLLPQTEAVAQGLGTRDKIKRMDLGGVAILVTALILFILAFTQAPVDGYDSAIFIAPFVVSLVLMVAFFTWEKFMPRGYTLLPHDIWSFPNIFPLLLQASAIFMWFATGQLRLATYFQDVMHNSAIHAAVKLLPMGITALFVGVLTQALPWLITRPRYVQPIASLLCFAGSMLWAFSDGGHGTKYWSHIFVGEVIGTAGGMIVFIGMNTAIIQAFPLEFAGVGGSFANVIFQIGGVIGIAIQAGLVSTGDGTLEDWTGTKNGYFFTSAYILLTGAIFVVWYRQAKMPHHEGAVAAV